VAGIVQEVMAVKSARKPWLAALLSLLVPGLGQAYAGRHDRGLIILAVAAFYAFFALQTLTLMEAHLLAEGENLFSWAKENLLRLGVNGLRLFAAVFLSLVLYAWVILDAYLSASNAKEDY
jgi:hypothetical protein